VGDDNILVQVPKGLFGFYKGAFTAMPYYVKVKAYNNAENRDLFEYKLNFTQTETRKLILHLWELNRANMDYVFAKRNCSYEILALIEAARPDWVLTEKLIMTAAPINTVRVLRDNTGALKDVQVRPSLKEKLQAKWDGLQDQEKDDYFKIISKGVKAMHSSDSLRNLSIGELIRGVSSEIAWQYRAVFVQAIWPVWAIGLSTAANNIICGMATSKSKLIIKRLGGIYKSVYRGLLLSRLIQIIAVAWVNVLSPLTIGLSSIFDSTSNLAIDSEKQNLMPDKQRATVSSLNSFISSITFSVVIILISKAIDVLGINRSLIIFFAISLLSLPFYLKAFKSLKKANT
jgi:hypothetical protein